MREPSRERSMSSEHEILAPSTLSDELVDELAAVLIDCVEGGASVGFMHDSVESTAHSFWRRVADEVARGERAIVIARDALGVCGTVQLVLSMPANQPHRADVCKMLVHRRARRRGLGEALLRRVEDVARERGKSLLVLDTVTDSDAHRLYARLGWERVGDIPNYALFPDGRPCSTTYFFKRVEG